MTFPYNRGWENQPNSRGLYTHYKDSYQRLDDHPLKNATFDHGTHSPGLGVILLAYY